MSALSTPGGGGTTAQSKPTSGKQKFQKLDINSLYCANKNESSEPSSVKSQLSRRHGMQSLGKVPSARRPPANLPSLKTETGQDSNTISTSVTATTVTPPTTCTVQTVSTTSSNMSAGTGPGGWVQLPPPSSPHFRTEFPSLEAAAQPSHRSSDHSTPQPQLRPQTEGSWTCGGTAGVRQEASSTAAAPVSMPASQQAPVYRAILPSFLMKGSSGSGLGMGTLGALRDSRSVVAASGGNTASSVGSRPPPRPPVTPRAVEVLTARPILREEQISSLDDISRDAGWAQQDDIDYDQKLDFSDGETSAPANKIKIKNNNNNRSSIENESVDSKIQEPGDEEQLWAERRQKHNNEMAQVAARARQIKEEEQRRQMRDSVAQPPKDSRTDKIDRDRSDYRDRDTDSKEKDRNDNREREQCQETRERDRLDNRDKDRDKERMDTRDRFENRDRDRDTRDNRDRDTRDRDRDTRDRDRDRIDVRDRDRLETRDKGRNEIRERQENDKEKIDVRDRDRSDNRDRDRERFEKDRERPDRDRFDRERTDRDRDFRERDRDYGRERDQSNPAFSKTFQANIPPRFLKQQQNRQQDDQHNKPWSFPGKTVPPRRQEPPPPYNPPRHAHNGRRSYSRDYSDREDEFRRDKDAVGPQWRSEMHDYERTPRDLDRSNSKEHGDYKDRRNDSDRKSIDSSAEPSSRTSAAEKLTEVFERKSIALAEPFASSDSSSHTQISERRNSPPSNLSRRESSERDFGKTSWAEVTQDEPSNFTVLKPSSDKTVLSKDNHLVVKDLHNQETNKEETNNSGPHHVIQTPHHHTTPANIPISSSNQLPKYVNNTVTNFAHNPTVSQANSFGNISQQTISVTQSQTSLSNSQLTPQSNQSLAKPVTSIESISNISHTQIQSAEQLLPVTKPTYTSQKSEKDLSESESVASKSSTDPSRSAGMSKSSEVIAGKPLINNIDSQKRCIDDKKSERFSNEQLNKIPSKEPIERKSSGSGSEKKGRGYGAGGFAVYNNRGWGSRESRGRRSHRSSRSNNRASESDASTDGVPNTERKERRKAPRSPRGPKKPDNKSEDLGRPPPVVQAAPITDGMENREPFAPRGQPSRRGRGGFQGASRPPAPAKRVAGYGPPNTKSPFSQANRAVKENEDCKDNQIDDKGKVTNNNKPRNATSGGRGRDRRPKGGIGPLSGEDENWETTSEHSEGGSAVGRRRSVGGRPSTSQKGQGGRNQNTNNRNGRNFQGGKKDSQLDNKTNDISEATSDNKTSDITEEMTDLKLSVKKDDEVVDDGFQEVRNKKNSKDARGPNAKEEQPPKQPRSHSNQGSGRNGSSSRNSNDKSNSRGSAPVSSKSGSQYERPRQANLAPRFVKQRQKQQMSLATGFGPDTGAAPPPPPVNAWDKPISQTLRGNIEESVEVVETKPSQTSQRSTPGDIAVETKNVPNTCTLAADKTGVLDGATPPVETIIFENTNYKTAPPAEALKQKYQTAANPTKAQDDIPAEMDARPMNFNGDVRPPPARTIQELIAENSRPVTNEEGTIGLQINFDTSQKTEDSSDMKLDFAFDSDLGQLTEDKSAKALVGLPRATHMSTSNTISPLAADLNLKIASVKKVWEMPAVAEGSEELQFAGFEEANIETGAPPNVCKVKPTQQLQSPPPQHYNHVGYQGGYGGLSSPPAVLFNSSQQLLSSSQQLPQQGGLYGAFLDQSRGQFGGFPGTPYGAGSAAPYNYQPPPDMFQSLPSQYRMAAAAAGGGAAFGQSGQLGNNPSTVLISSTSNSLMSATVKPSSQQIGAIGSKGGGVGGVGGVNTYQQQYLGYSGPVGEAPYSLPGLLPRPAPPASSYYSPYQPQAAPAPTYPLQFTQPAQSGAFSSQFLSSQLQVAAAVQQMQQQYRAPLQQQYAPPQPQPRGPPQPPLKSPLHEHANGFALDGGSPTPKGKPKAPHSPPQHKYHAPPPPPHMQHPPPAHTPHQHHQQHQQHQQQMVGGNNGRCGSGGGARGPSARFPTPIQRPLAPALPMYRAPPQPLARHHAPRPNLYYHHQRNGGNAGGGGGSGGTVEGSEGSVGPEEGVEAPVVSDAPPPAEVKAE